MSNLPMTPIPLPKFYGEKQTYSTKKERNGTPRDSIPPRPPIKSAPPVSRIFPHRDANIPQAVSFKDKEQSLHSPVYDQASCSLYFDQCFDIESRLGCGAFGEVFKAKSKENGQYYAIKRSRIRFRGESDRKRRFEEVKKHEKLPKHPNCVAFMKAWEERNHLYIQTELCKNSLSAYSEQNHSISEYIIWGFLVDLLMALQHLHAHDLVHMDIKPENIFISDGDICKIGDFGLVIDLSKGELAEAQEGDPKYMAPELMDGHFGKAADIYSLGITILELASDLDLPRNGDHWHELRCGKLPEEFMLGMSENLQKVIKWMMEPNPANRPSVDEILQSPLVYPVWVRRRRTVVLHTFVAAIQSAFKRLWILMVLSLWAIAQPVRGIFSRFFPGFMQSTTETPTKRAHPVDWDYSFSDGEESFERSIHRQSSSSGSPLNDSKSSRPSRHSSLDDEVTSPKRLNLSYNKMAAKDTCSGNRLANGLGHPQTEPGNKRTLMQPRANIVPKNLLKAFENLSDEETS